MGFLRIQIQAEISAFRDSSAEIRESVTVPSHLSILDELNLIRNVVNRVKAGFVPGDPGSMIEA